VTAWWQTSFCATRPKSDSLLLLDERLAAGQHAIPVPDLVPPRAAFATVQVDVAIYAFSHRDGTVTMATVALVPGALGSRHDGHLARDGRHRPP
jgi:hypothetical protein